MIRDPYQVLGVREGASMDEIKRAYRRKAKEYHPDLHPDDPKANARMQEINEAYDMLCNPGKYQTRQQPRPEPRANPNTGAANDGNWRYTYYYTNAEPRREAGMVRPFGGLFRFIGGILLFRFLMTLLRFGLFGPFGFFL